MIKNQSSSNYCTQNAMKGIFLFVGIKKYQIWLIDSKKSLVDDLIETLLILGTRLNHKEIHICLGTQFGKSWTEEEKLRVFQIYTKQIDPCFRYYYNTRPLNAKVVSFSLAICLFHQMWYVCVCFKNEDRYLDLFFAHFFFLWAARCAIIFKFWILSSMPNESCANISLLFKFCQVVRSLTTHTWISHIQTNMLCCTLKSIYSSHRAIRKLHYWLSCCWLLLVKCFYWTTNVTPRGCCSYYIVKLIIFLVIFLPQMRGRYHH